jgi:hypothetical protein
MNAFAHPSGCQRRLEGLPSTITAVKGDGCTDALVYDNPELAKT